MPYDGEKALVNTALRRLLESEDAVRMRAQMRRVVPPRPEEAEGVVVPRPERLPRFVIAIDGSHLFVPLEEGWASAEMGAVTVASVMIDLERLAQTRVSGIPNPRAFAGVKSAHGVEMLLPSVGVTMPDCGDARESFRSELYRALGARRLNEEGETLLETYEALTAGRPEATRPLGCPLMDACGQPDARYREAPGQTVCACGERPVYSTDALRLHEAFADGGSNVVPISGARAVVEHLVLLNLLRSFERLGLLSALEDVAFVMDGPLAVSGEAAWLSWGIRRELRRLSERAGAIGAGLPIVFGIEKTGAFQDHMLRLDTGPKVPKLAGDPRELAAQGTLERGRAILLHDEYIKRHILYRPDSGGKAYGETSHYGRKVLYKTAGGARITVMTAFLKDGDDDTRCTPRIEQFGRLGTALSLLDRLVSSAHPDATVPLVMAHAEASLPLAAAEGVLKRFLLERGRR